MVVSDYPFARGTDLSHYDMIYVPELSAYFVIVGIVDIENAKTKLATISQFHDGVWKRVGQLNAARFVSFYSCSCSELLVLLRDDA